MKTLTHNDLGKKLLVEECQKISITEYTQRVKISLKKKLLETELEYDDVSVTLTTSQTNRNGLRYWFMCPICIKRCGVLFVHPMSLILACRRCLNLRYKKSRFKKMVENN